MEVSDPTIKNNISSELIGVLKRLFDSWGPRLEYILRFTILALLDYPDSTMLGITRMLTEKGFRNKVIKEIKDPIVKNFWVNEYASWNDKFASEAVAPVLNKVGAFTANPLIRNIIGQPKSSVDLRKVMDEGKILVVNLSNGLIGEDNAGILGSLMVTKMQLAAMSRANIERDQRRPFYLYVDEFQNFATDSFAVILSEARKYGLNLTVANQYVSQMPETVRDAVFGNVGSMITFRVGAADGTVLSKYFEPGYEPADLVKLNNQHILVNMIIDGEKSIPFAGRTLKMPETQQDHTATIIAHSREKYASDVAEVEQKIAHWTLSGGDDVPAPAVTPQGHLGNISPNMAQQAQTQPQSEASSFIQTLQNPNMPAAQPREQNHRPDHRSNDRQGSNDRNRPRHAGRR
jgi:hypothetical protein